MDRNERLGLGVSTAGHILLFGALSLGLLQTVKPPIPSPPSIDVTLADEVALQSRTTQHTTEPPQVATAPELGPVEPDAAPPEPAPAPVPPQAVAPPPSPRAQDPVRPPQRAAPPRPAPPRRARPSEEEKPAPSRAAPREQARNNAPPRRASRLGDDFLRGIQAEANSPRNTGQSAGSNAPLGAAQARALNAEISRQLKRYWRAPTGADADQLVTVLSWRLNRDGTIAAGPDVVEQTGQTASNRPQQQLHIEAAIRAVRAAAPFQLPPELYDSWKYIQKFSFDRRL